MESLYKYKYTGPVYFNDNKIAEKSNLETTAKSIGKAKSNFLFRLANGNIPVGYDIVDTQIIKGEEIKPIQRIIHKKCDICGYELNDMGDCPVCKYGEYDLVDINKQLVNLDD